MLGAGAAMGMWPIRVWAGLGFLRKKWGASPFGEAPLQNGLPFFVLDISYR